MTDIDTMVEAAIPPYLEAWPVGDDAMVALPIALRAAIEAALAVRSVPTDAEIEAAIEHLVDLSAGAEFDRIYTLVDDDAMPRRRKSRDLQRDIVLRLIAAQRSEARREALEEHEPSADEIEAGARRLWSELPGEAYRDYELGMVATDWDDARHESQVTYRNVVVDVCKAMAEWRMPLAKEDGDE